MEFRHAPKKVLSVGQKASSLWIVGRCPTQQDHSAGVAFTKGTASLLHEAFALAGHSMQSEYRTLVVPHLPPLGKIEGWHLTLKQMKEHYPEELQAYKKFLGPVAGKYLHPGIMPFVAALQADIQTHRPNVIVALGAEVCQILTGESRISAARGALYDCQLCPGVKVIPTHNPASLFANAALQPIFRADIAKALRESAYPELRLKNRNVYVAETLDDLQWFESKFRSGAATVDIETVPNWKQITDIGIAYSDTEVLVIPILDKTKPDYSYWKYEDEFKVWEYVRRVLADPEVEIRGQGYIYDATWLYQLLLIPSREYRGDPLNLHHALYPEMSKDLGFLGSLYCDETAWKQLASFKQAKKGK